MKLLYVTSLSYPGVRASHMQTLATAQALGDMLGDTFIFAAAQVGNSELYTHSSKEFGHHIGPVLAWKQLKYIASESIDLVYSRESSLMCYLIVLNTLFFHLPLRFFFEAHGVYDHEWNPRFRYVVTHANHIFCLTSLLAEKLKSAYGARSVSVLPDAVDANFFSGAEHAGDLYTKYHIPNNIPLVSYIGSVGRYDWKGVDVFLAARGEVPPQDALFIVAGVTEHIEQWRMRYPHGILFLPWIPRTEAAALMRISSVLVLPNKANNQVSANYTSPMKLFEYMASGTPIVASDLPSIREIVNAETACLVSPDSAIALAQGISSVLTNQDEARERATRAQAKVRTYSWEQRAQDIGKVIATT